ncbi:Plant self-incompatibility response [Arabidopsis suecica]|uniref:Plant self-incompatibility response n=1 Tax=Arabidopsis suecica TaxID=45249 RepID=A0A8T1ZGC5_ARASU|nr:Plant self-incompatibility response [Arabidopsis suecica]
MKKFGCNTTHPFPGKCGNNGRITCVSDMKKIPGAPKNRDIRCECSYRPSLTSRLPGERICRCDYDC